MHISDAKKAMPAYWGATAWDGRRLKDGASASSIAVRVTPITSVTVPNNWLIFAFLIAFSKAISLACSDMTVQMVISVKLI